MNLLQQMWANIQEKKRQSGEGKRENKKLTGMKAYQIPLMMEDLRISLNLSTFPINEKNGPLQKH